MAERVVGTGSFGVVFQVLGTSSACVHMSILMFWFIVCLCVDIFVNKDFDVSSIST